MSICLVVDDITQTIVNRIVADLTDISPEGTRLMLEDDGVMCDIGWTWDGTQFVHPMDETN